MENCNIFFNPGIDDFLISVNSVAYVDKTELILHINKLLNTKKRYICVSSPRGFGKTTIVNMLTAYYSYSKIITDVFDNENISKTKDWNKYLGQFNVIKLNMFNFIHKNLNIEELSNSIYSILLNEIRESVPKFRTYNEKKSFSWLFQKLFNQTHRKIVLIIDEWDYIFRLNNNDKNFQKKYIDFLTNFIVKKDYIALTYMTGIIPIKKNKTPLSLDIFDNYSILSPSFMSKFMGFTENEVKKLCTEHKLNINEIKEYYNGYHLKQTYHEINDNGNSVKKNTCTNIYNPSSIVNVIISKKVENYWNITKEYDTIRQYVQTNYKDLKEDFENLINGKRIKNNIIKYQNDVYTLQNKDDIIILLVYLGYLSYDIETKEIYIPNKEMLSLFKTLLENKLYKHYDQSNVLLEATWNLDSDTVAKLIEEAYNDVPSKQNLNKNTLTSSIMNAYYTAKEYYTILFNVDDGKGFDDIVFLPAPGHYDKPVLLFELKNEEENLETITEEIQSQNYPKNFEEHYDKMLFIRIKYSNFNHKEKHISCIIEKYEK